MTGQLGATHTQALPQRLGREPNFENNLLGQELDYPQGEYLY